MTRAKEFQDAPSSRAQIKILQQMLKDLGMDGRPTLPKAKSIKEARELAAELSTSISYSQVAILI